MSAHQDSNEENAVTESGQADHCIDGAETHAGEHCAEAAGEENPIEEQASEEFAEWLEAVDSGLIPKEGLPPESGEISGDEGENPPEAPAEDNAIADMERQLAETRDQLLRKAADFENFRKRMNQEKQSAIEYANQSLLMDIIPIIDDFERAIQSAEASEELTGLPAGKAMIEGIAMIEKRLLGQLENKWGLKRYISAGAPFDPSFHEAMFMEKTSGVEEAVVQEEFAKGYTLKDRVIRAAKVKVLMPEEGEQ